MCSDEKATQHYSTVLHLSFETPTISHSVKGVSMSLKVADSI